MPEIWNNLTKASHNHLEGKSPPAVGRTSADRPGYSGNTAAAGKSTKQAETCAWTGTEARADLSRKAIPLVFHGPVNSTKRLTSKPYSTQRQTLTSGQSFCLKPTSCLDTRKVSSECSVSLRIPTTKATELLINHIEFLEGSLMQSEPGRPKWIEILTLGDKFSDFDKTEQVLE